MRLASAGRNAAIADFLIDLFFIIDLLLNFRSAYVDRKTGHIVTSSKRMALHYLRSWFFIDFFGTSLIFH